MRAQNPQFPAAEIAKLIGERWRKLGPVQKGCTCTEAREGATGTARPRKK
jgi:hypothetical protein